MTDISLEPISHAHAERMLQWMSDPVVAHNLGLRSEPSLPRTLEWIDRARNDPGTLALAVLASGNHVGNVILDQLDTHLNTARLVIYLGDQRGQGLGKKALRAAIHKGFVTLELHKIWLTVHVQNTPALRAYTAVGFRVEGILRDEFLFNGRRLDVFRMGLLRREFVDD